MGKVKIKVITGNKFKKLQADLGKMKKRYTGAFAAALFQKGAEIFSESQEEVPVDTGWLRSTGAVYPPKFIYEPIVIIAYGTAYGLYVHEDPSKRHGPVIGGGKGQKFKYLEDPFKKAMLTFKARMIYLTRRNVKLGIWKKPTRKIKGTKGTNVRKKKKGKGKK